MFELKRWEPMRELSTIQRDLDDLFRRTFGSLTPSLLRGESRGEWFPAVNCYMKEGKYVVDVDLPGVDPKDVDISITGKTLSIKGERKSEVKKEKEGYIFHESSYGTFERSMTLPEGVEAGKAHATYANGVLHLTMPAKSEALPKKVKVEVSEEESKGTKGTKAA